MKIKEDAFQLNENEKEDITDATKEILSEKRDKIKSLSNTILVNQYEIRGDDEFSP